MTKNIFNLILIISIAFLVRIIGIHYFPPSLNWDEASLGYNAYSLFESGKDEWGKAAPLIFQAFGDYKLPGYIYFSVPAFLYTFNPYLIRLVSVVAGVVTTFSVYYLTLQITKKTHLASISALLVALSPWSVFQSRIALEANLALALFTLAVAAYKRHPLSTGLLLGLSALTYNTYRIFVPVFLVVVYIFYRPKLSQKHFYSGLVTFFCFVPIIIQFVNGTGSARYRWVEILDQGAISFLENSRNNSSLPSLATKIIYNRPVYFLTNSAKNYLSHFSPIFLFLNGGSNYQFNIPQTGLLYLFTSPFILLGVLISARSSKAKVLFVWLITAPLAAALTRDAPHALRASPLLVPLVILTSLGLEKVIRLFNSIKLIIFIFCFTLLVGFGSYYLEWRDYSVNYSWAWQFGHEQLAKIVKSNYSSYDNFIITKRFGEPHIFLLYYLHINPNFYNQDKNLLRYFRSDWYWVDSFDKYKFVNDWDMPNYVGSLDNQKKYLIISSTETPIGIGKLLSQISLLDGKPAFNIYQYP